MTEPTCVSDCRFVTFPVSHEEARGSLAYVYNGVHIPFDVRRVYYLYDVPAGSERGGHAHRNLTQLIVAASGSFDVKVKDEAQELVFTLNRPSYGLLIRPMIWRELLNFSGGAISLVLASLPYDEFDYIRDFSVFRDAKGMATG